MKRIEFAQFELAPPLQGRDSRLEYRDNLDGLDLNGYQIRLGVCSTTFEFSEIAYFTPGEVAYA